MREISFKHVIVIGYGVVAGEVLKNVHQKSIQYGYTVEYIEHEVHPFNQGKKFAEARGVEYHVIETNDELLKYFLQKVSQKVLIISVNNNFIFPAKLISNENVVIINFHNALLPELPGRNAPSWAIYEGKKATGITWHYVTEKIDAGEIIIQKKCVIDDDVKAYELVASQMKLASDAFIECFDDILYGMVRTKKQVVPEYRKIYKSFEIPGNGKFNLEDSTEKIYRLLRSMDYGKNDIFPMPVTRYGGNDILIRKYKKVKKSERKEGKYQIYLPFDNEHFLMLKYDLLYDGEIRGGVEDIEYLYYLVSELKKVNRRLISNCYLSGEKISSYIDNNNFFYSYVPTKYLNIWYRERDFVRLYYYIAHLDHYEIPSIELKIICDQFYQEETDVTVSINNVLRTAGLNEYALYHKWVRNNQTVPCKEFDDDIVIEQRIESGYFEMLERCFDAFSDFLPENDHIEEFFSKKICYSAILKTQKILVGGLVITKRGNVQTEEFIFVDEAYRGRGIADRLHKHWYEHAGNDKTQFIAWIRDDNNESMQLHLKNGYVKKQTYKLTMMKG